MADFTFIRVTGIFTLPDGQAAGTNSYVSFLPTAEMTNTLTGARIPASIIYAHLDSQGQMRDPNDHLLGVNLAANDDPTTTPSGVSYLVTEYIGARIGRSYLVSLPYDAPGGTVSLGKLVPGSTAPPTYYVLTNVRVPAPFTVALVGGVAQITWDGSGALGYALTQNAQGEGVWTPLGSLGGDKNYIHTQTLSATTWVVVHNLQKECAVDVVSSAGDVIEGDVHYDSLNQLTLTFSAPFSGTATCN